MCAQLQCVHFWATARQCTHDLHHWQRATTPRRCKTTSDGKRINYAILCTPEIIYFARKVFSAIVCVLHTAARTKTALPMALAHLLIYIQILMNYGCVGCMEIVSLFHAEHVSKINRQFLNAFLISLNNLCRTSCMSQTHPHTLVLVKYLMVKDWRAFRLGWDGSEMQNAHMQFAVNSIHSNLLILMHASSRIPTPHTQMKPKCSAFES